jgi:hypothetical protein
MGKVGAIEIEGRSVCGFPGQIIVNVDEHSEASCSFVRISGADLGTDFALLQDESEAGNLGRGPRVNPSIRIH